jgi:hypothetical protein
MKKNFAREIRKKDAKIGKTKYVCVKYAKTAKIDLNRGPSFGLRA